MPALRTAPSPRAVRPPTSPGSGTGYQYQGSGRSLSPGEAAARLAQPHESSEGEPARRRLQAGGQPVSVAKALKGAVKVDGFPERCKYPFREIASDGGVWRLDPAVFKCQPQTIRSAAFKWADKHGFVAKPVLDEGYVYVQFTPKAQ